MRSFHFPKFGSLLKQHFFTGVLVLTPLAVSVWILISAFNFISQIKELLPASLQPDRYSDNEALLTVFNLLLTGAACLVMALLISLLGWASKQFFGKKILEWLSEGIQRIPVIRSVYGALDQLLRTLGTGGGQQFHRVVYVEYPRKGSWALAFVTGQASACGFEKHLNIYVPTTPNPTSGFHLLVSENEVRESEMTVEEAFRTILSLGLAQPPPKEKTGN